MARSDGCIFKQTINFIRRFFKFKYFSNLYYVLLFMVLMSKINKNVFFYTFVASLNVKISSDLRDKL